MTMSASPEPLLVRAYKGEAVERTPVWLMRQAGRYMADFRKYSEKYGFRQRSETPDIAIELSLQPWRRFGVDGIIMFSDILTPLPALGVDFSITEGKGPCFAHPLRSREDIQRIGRLHDPDQQLPFISPLLRALRAEAEAAGGGAAVIGFIGAPWTLAAYSVEGGPSKLCKHMKLLCMEQPAAAHSLLDKYTDMLCAYASHQVRSGAQVLQVFESWAHHLSEQGFRSFAKPYAQRIAQHMREQHPEVPVVYFANGGSAFLPAQLDMAYDALALDWSMSMASARAIAGPRRVLGGNMDPSLLYGSEQRIIEAVGEIVRQAGPGHVMGVGHGVEKDMNERAVEVFVQAAQALAPPPPPPLSPI